LQTQFGDKHQTSKLKELKSLYPEQEQQRGSILVRKNTMLLEHNTIEEDILHSIHCEAVALKKNLKEYLEKLIASALDNNNISDSQVKPLMHQFNFVVYKINPGRCGAA
jgi:hypothetical protein